MHVGNDLKELEWIAETAQNPQTVHYRRYCDWWLDHQDEKSMMREIRKVTSIRTSLGWSKSRLFRRCASMPLHVFALMRQMCPEFATSSPDGIKLLRKFLVRRPEFSTSWGDK